MKNLEAKFVYYIFLEFESRSIPDKIQDKMYHVIIFFNHVKIFIKDDLLLPFYSIHEKY
jgi:hypothetical protein